MIYLRLQSTFFNDITDYIYVYCIFIREIHRISTTILTHAQRATLSFSVITENIDLLTNISVVFPYHEKTAQNHTCKLIVVLFLLQMMLPAISRVNRAPHRPFWVAPVFLMVS